jgi:hypothetical protein
MPARRRHARKQRAHRPHVGEPRAELRADVERAGDRLAMTLIQMSDEAMERLRDKARTSNEPRSATIAAMLSNVMRTLDDPAYPLRCILCKKRLERTQIALSAIVHANSDQPRAGILCFVCAECARQHPTPALLSDALEPHIRHGFGSGRLQPIAISSQRRAPDAHPPPLWL